MKYKILRAGTTEKLEELMNNMAETHRPVGTFIYDGLCYNILMEEK